MCKLQLTADFGRLTVIVLSRCKQRDTCSPTIELQNKDQSELCVKQQHILRCGCSPPSSDLPVSNNICNKGCQGEHAQPTHVIRLPRRKPCDGAECRHEMLLEPRVYKFYEPQVNKDTHETAGSDPNSPATTFSGIFGKLGMQDTYEEIDEDLGDMMKKKKKKRGFLQRGGSYKPARQAEQEAMQEKEEKTSMFRRATSWSVRR